MGDKGTYLFFLFNGYTMVLRVFLFLINTISVQNNCLNFYVKIKYALHVYKD